MRGSKNECDPTPTLLEPASRNRPRRRPAQVRRLETELLGAVLVLRERQRIDDVQHELALGRSRREFLEHLADASGVRRRVGNCSVASFEKKK